MNMFFPDQSHINRVRDALWQRSVGGASVMIGAGFSRNAEKTRPEAPDPPTWREVAEEICHKLYPDNDDKHRHSAIEATSETSGFLRLAQEYEADCGRSDLHGLIQQIVRDDDFKPGNMHSRLLRLHWRDVFTTNWDTLLERTRPTVIEPAYSVVRNMQKIPLSARPRIVKLHGSLPDQFPLIFTEEDYRTYPVKFAPFVNTVQQSMMETVFCLIGFSGDDPNFLHWSGWVRDNLGDSAPKIYLAGWLDLSSHRRRMLEDRNVVPIDLALHPKAARWPEHLRHSYATDWLLHALEGGRPYDDTDWPTPPGPLAPRPPEILQPVQEVASDGPIIEPEDPSEETGQAKDTSQQVHELLGVWNHNRKTYPGWLFVPFGAQTDLSRKTREWEPQILRVLPELHLVDELNAIRELVWRHEILLEPIPPELEEAAQAVLGNIDCQARTMNGDAPKAPDWAAIRESCLVLGLALVTAARQRFDRVQFDERIASLSDLRDDNRDVAHRIHHETCLWAIYSLDFETLDTLLRDWRIENSDPAWMMRKSALLFETGQFNAAKPLIASALAAIRENPGDHRSFAGPSREGWALWLTWPVLTLEDLDDAEAANQRPPFRRWDELTPLKCNAFMEKRNYLEALKASQEALRAPSFEFDMKRSPGIVFSNAEYNQWIAARRAVRLAEIAGLPPSSHSLVVASDILGLAADRLALHEPELAARLVLRIASFDGDERLNLIFSRVRVAAMPEELAIELVRICEKVIDFALPRMTDRGPDGRGRFAIDRLRVSLEALSRFVIRLEPTIAEPIFSKALNWYGNIAVARDIQLAAPVHNIVKRSWEALPENHRVRHVLDILGAPIAGMDGFPESHSRCPDPGYLLPNDIVPPSRIPDNDDRWREIIGFLIRALRSRGKERMPASVRMAWMSFRKLLTDAEQSLMSEALWGEDYSNHHNLPDGTDLYDWSFLILPEPEPGIAEQRFRRKWLDAEVSAREDPLPLDEILDHVGAAILNLKIHRRPLKFSDQEQKHVAELVGRWAEAPVPPPIQNAGMSRPVYLNDGDRRTRQTIEGLRSVLLEVTIAESVAEKLFEKGQRLNETTMPGLGLAAGLIKLLPERFDEIVLSMRMGLTSDSDHLAKDAVRGLWFWLRIMADPKAELQAPPDDLVREIGIIIANRRKVALGQALQMAKWVFSDGDSKQREAMIDLVSQGLGYLAQELRYDRSHDHDEDVPLLRWGCVHLALAMAGCGIKDPAVSRWMKIAETDPLPEVRHAKRAVDAPDGGRESDPDVVSGQSEADDF